MRGVCCLFILAACGSSKVSSPVSPPTPLPTSGAYAVASADALPPCDASHSGQLLFIEAEKRFVVCHEPTWTTIDLKGETGDAGQDGQDAAATSMFSASIYCGGQLESTGIWFEYDAGLLKSGDVFANGGIRNGVIEVSQTKFFSKSQVGAATAAVNLSFDLQGPANGGFWRLELNRTTLVTTIIYHDTDAAGGMTTWTMTPDKCVNNTYP